VGFSVLASFAGPFLRTAAAPLRRGRKWEVDLVVGSGGIPFEEFFASDSKERFAWASACTPGFGQGVAPPGM
jgi:hypothetical protein